MPHDFTFVEENVNSFLMRNGSINKNEEEIIKNAYNGDANDTLRAAKMIELSGDIKTANFFYEIAADSNQMEAAFTLGKYYINGVNGLEIDIAKGKKFIQQAKKLGYEKAINFLIPPAINQLKENKNNTNGNIENKEKTNFNQFKENQNQENKNIKANEKNEQKKLNQQTSSKISKLNQPKISNNQFIAHQRINSEPPNSHETKEIFDSNNLPESNKQKKSFQNGEEQIISNSVHDKNSSSNDLICIAEKMLDEGEFSKACNLYKIQAENGNPNLFMKCAELSSTFEEKLGYYECAIRHKISNAFGEWRKCILKHLSLIGYDKSNCIKFAKVFEKQGDFSDACSLYQKGEDELNFQFCYEKAKMNIENIQDGHQQFSFAFIIEKQNEIKLAITMFKKAFENGVKKAEKKINKLSQNQSSQQSSFVDQEEKSDEFKTDFEIAQNYMNQKLYALSAFYMKKSADEGDPEGINGYGDCLKYGKGVNKDLMQAKLYYQIAAEKESVKGMFNFGELLYLNGESEEEKKKAALYIKKAANKLHPDAIYYYSKMLEQKDPEESKKFFDFSIQKGSEKAISEYGKQLKHEGKINEAAELYKFAADKGLLIGYRKFAKCIFKDESQDNNKKCEIIRYYMKNAAEIGEARDYYNYANYLYHFFHGDSKEECAKYFKKACDEGFLKAFFYYSECLRTGYGVEKNVEEAGQYIDLSKRKDLNPKAIKNINSSECLHISQNISQKVNENGEQHIKEIKKLNEIEFKISKSSQNVSSIQSICSKENMNSTENKSKAVSTNISQSYNTKESIITNESKGTVENTNKTIKINASQNISAKDKNEDIEQSINNSISPNGTQLQNEKKIINIKEKVDTITNINKAVNINEKESIITKKYIDTIENTNKSINNSNAPQNITTKEKANSTPNVIIIQSIGPTQNKNTQEKSIKTNENTSRNSQMHIIRQIESKGIHFNPSHSFKGIIYYLTNQCGGNVSDKGVVKVTSKDYSNIFYPQNVVDFSLNTMFVSKNTIDNWICFDFIDKRIIPTSYMIKTNDDMIYLSSENGKISSCHLKSWLIEVSNNEIEWIEVDHRENNFDLNFPNAVKNFETKKRIECRYFRLRQIGPNHGGCYYIALNAFEIFGKLNSIKCI